MYPADTVAEGASIPTGLAAPAADPWRRFMSIVYEGVILFGVVFFFTYAFSAVTRWQGHPGTLRWVYQFYMYGVLGAYFAWFWSEGRRTLPMKTMSILLQRRDGTPVPRGQAFLRYTVAGLWPAAVLAAMKSGLSPWLAPLMFVPFLWPLVDRERRALYDIVCGTRLAFVPIPRAPKRSGKPAA